MSAAFHTTGSSDVRNFQPSRKNPNSDVGPIAGLCFGSIGPRSLSCFCV